MESKKHPILEIKKLARNKFEQQPNTPIVDIIRHGETEYEQRNRGFHRAPMLNAKAPAFKLNTDHLDLNKEGIESIERAFNQIADMMDIESEVALIISSPAWRTHSSALVGEKILRGRGISILNAEQEPKFSKTINQHSYFFEKVLKKNYGDNETTARIINDYIEKGYKIGIAEASETFGVDIQEKMREAEHLDFQKFLRYITNIYRWLSNDTLKILRERRLRIIVLAHEENTLGLIKETMPEGTIHNNGQILEIT